MLTSNVIYPIPPAFRDDGGPFGIVLDPLEIARYIAYLKERGARKFMVTAGTSQFHLLDGMEVEVVNECVAYQMKEEDTEFIAGIPACGIHEHELWAPMIKDLKPSAVLVLYPERYYGHHDIVSFFAEVVTLYDPIPVWVHGMPIRGGCTPEPFYYDHDLSSKLKKAGVKGMKEESFDRSDCMRAIAALADEDFQVCLAGGSGERLFKAMETTIPNGYLTYLAGIGSFDPQQDERLLRLLREGGYCPKNAENVRQVQGDIMQIAKKWGWHRVMRHILHTTGRLGKHVDRAPFQTDQIGKEFEEDCSRWVKDCCPALLEKTQ